MPETATTEPPTTEHRRHHHRTHRYRRRPGGADAYGINQNPSPAPSLDGVVERVRARIVHSVGHYQQRLFGPSALFDLLKPPHHRIIQRGLALGVKEPDPPIQVR